MEAVGFGIELEVWRTIGELKGRTYIRYSDLFSVLLY